MSSPGAPIEAIFGQFQQEVVRWNRQINLVSRQDTLKRVAVLIGQCRRAWLQLNGLELLKWPDEAPVTYFDLGSGGGLPGFIWHVLFSERFEKLETILVEPREKRAWFLERLHNLAPDSDLGVWNQRWGDAGCSELAHLANTVISLKALRLSDLEVLTGLAAAAENSGAEDGSRVVIARFYPANQKWTPELAASLAPLGEKTTVGRFQFEPCGSRILPPETLAENEAALVVSIYQTTENRI